VSGPGGQSVSQSSITVNPAAPTPIVTETPIVTDIPVVAETPTLAPTEVASAPSTAGRFPYVADFEAQNPLASWEFDTAAWQVIDESGENFLVGQADVNQPMVILGTASPDWLNTGDLAISFRFNLDANAPGARLIFRDSEAGYEALQVKPGEMSLRRSAAEPDLFAPDSERVLQTVRAPIQANHWHSVVVWADGSRIFIYLDNKLTMTVEDLTPPQLAAGKIELQLNSTTTPVRFDDFIIQKAEPQSGHFEGADFPPSWTTTNATISTLGQEQDGNQFIRLEGGAVSVAPDMRDIANLNLTYRVYIRQGGYQLRVRHSSEGTILMDFVGGVMTVSQLDGAGGVVHSWQGVQFYNRQRWEEVKVQFIGDNLKIYRDATIRFDQVIENAPPAGGVQFDTRANDLLGIDDVLITEAATSSNEIGRVAYALNEEAVARPFRELRSDLKDDFDDILRTDDWWVDGRHAAGEFTQDPASSNHQYFLRMSDAGAITYRLFRDVMGVEMFRSGSDTVNFTNSTDLLVTADTRFAPGMSGTAWLSIRSTANSNGDVDGYRLELRHSVDGTTSAVASFVSNGEKQVYYEGPVPGLVQNGTDIDWVNLKIITLRDHVYFFANNTFIASADGRLALGGTLALGVDPATTADFDSLVIRDTSPHDA
jgi:hypothetical protein